ncbi:prenyltransferase/squalene oxidase repeat-containing protein [uncultured Methylobacterium sp.]|uniref:prenyltransferase/squalene oxidase repeat-containing protein n=1 Tax=uncultured Methylobacterium sp. TaxID=157278 RepID=UPI002618F6C0|nr:prenyltransferase/squalene oxidase repeat-containing protein [uncultured Methylobacterium sp.]
MSADGRAVLRAEPDPDEAGLRRLLALQDPGGAWEGEVVWCPVITAQVAIAHHVLGRAVDDDWRRGALDHFADTQHGRGGWGLHPASEPYRFVTTLVYVAARLLGEPADAPWLAPARSWLARGPGDVYGLPGWGKFWLFLLGLYDRDGLNPCPVELFLLPRRLPVAPDRLYCHTRMIYLGMATLMAMPPAGPRRRPDAFEEALRAELGLDGRRASAFRHHLADTDAHVRPGRLLRLGYDLAAAGGRLWHRLPVAARLRRRAVDHALALMAAEQRATRHQGLSPVSGVLHAIALQRAGRPEADAAVAGLEAWAWRDARGLRHAGARSTTWDTALAMQAVLAAPHRPAGGTAALARAHARLMAMQETEELPPGCAAGRQAIRGGWCFGDGRHRWPVSDCTAESLSALLLCEAAPGVIAPADRLPAARLEQAVHFLLARQNADGGFGTYERRRGGGFLERVNPSEMFGQCMTELSYVECTASALRALHHVATLSPGGAALPGIAPALDRGRAFLLRRQRPDGSWLGFWGINVVYGTLFGVWGLRAAGLAPDHPAIRRAARWLASAQRQDGGWGEHFSGCLEGRYVPAGRSLVIGTSWAVLALAEAGPEHQEAVRRGRDWLAARQGPDGDWPRDSVNGAFFGTAMLDYRLYNTIFPAWALAAASAGGGRP